MEFVKITSGFVRQRYDNGICVGQKFIAGDQVEHLGTDGISIPIPEHEEYQPFDMVQPDKEKEIDYYVIWVWGCVDPQLHGPYSTPEKQQTEIDRLRVEEGEDEHTFFVMNVTKGSIVEF